MLKLMRILFILPMILGFCLTDARCQTMPSSDSSQTDSKYYSDLDDDTLFLAATLWGEARDDSVGMQVVANTVLNRKKYYEQSNSGKSISIRDIVSNTDQFASWKGKDWDTADIIKNMAEYQGADKEKWGTCVRIAKLALKGTLADITGGATAYYVKDEEIPNWARGQTDVSTINNHVVVHGVKIDELQSKDNNVMTDDGSGQKASNPWESFVRFPQEAQSDSSSQSCDGVEALSRDISSATDSGHGILSDKTMKNMTEMLNRIYQNLGRVFMLGHGMLCYASKVAYTCIGLEVPGVVSACWIKSPHLSFFITGLAIYFTAFLMSVAIGMYFIDISFKLGFALMYLPVAVALWPFAPTRSKFGEAFGMILHNAMLYAFMSIGLTYAIVLIYNGVLGDVSNWSSFWSAVEKESSERLAENFSMSSTRVMVILFCLIFGFKILASSVNNYLDYFFSDGLMGGQSPMHYLGTQALGMTAGMTLGKVGSYVSDLASTQTGRLVEGGGNLLVNASNSDMGKFVSNTVNSTSNGIVKAKNYLSDFMSGKMSKAADNPTIIGRSAATSGAASAAATGAASVSAATAGANAMASQAGGSITGTMSQSPAETGSIGPQYANAEAQVSDGIKAPETGSVGPQYAATEAPAAESFQAPETGSVGPQGVSPYSIKEENGSASAVSFSVNGKTYSLSRENMNNVNYSIDGKAVTFDMVVNDIKNDPNSALARKAILMNGRHEDGSKISLRERMDIESEITRSQGNVVSRFFDATRPDENTLRPSNIIDRTSGTIGQGLRDTKSAILHPQATYRTVKQLATEGISDENSRFQNGMLIMKNTGKVIFRKVTPNSLQEGLSEDNTLAQNAGIMAKNAAVEGVKMARATTSDTVGFAGRLAQGLGKSMQQNYDKGGSSNFYADMQAKRKAEEEQKYYDDLVNKTDADNYDENN